MHVLAIGTLTTQDFQQYLPEEGEVTARWFQEGALKDLYVKADHSGPILVLSDTIQPEPRSGWPTFRSSPTAWPPSSTSKSSPSPTSHRPATKPVPARRPSVPDNRSSMVPGSSALMPLRSRAKNTNSFVSSRLSCSSRDQIWAGVPKQARNNEALGTGTPSKTSVTRATAT